MCSCLQHKTIESVLERGEKLDNLVDRSNALSAQSKMFYKTAKKVRPAWIDHLYSANTVLLNPAKLLLHHHVKTFSVNIERAPSLIRRMMSSVGMRSSTIAIHGTPAPSRPR
jgi:synaptobrevin family protein YKT6